MTRQLWSDEAEHGVLGGLMRSPEHCETVGSVLDASHFYSEDNAVLYAMILGCHSKKVHPDAIALSEVRSELPSGELTIVYASEIMMGVVSSANVKVYARTVYQRYQARRLHDLGSQIIDLSFQQGDIGDQIAEAQASIMALGHRDDRPDVVTMREALAPVFEKMQERLDGKAMLGQDFGLEDLDKVIRKLRPGNLVVIAGRPGTGKTVLGINLADRVAVVHGGGSLVFSLEMPCDELSKRSLASQAGVRQDSIESGQAALDGDSKLRMELAVSKLSKADIRICDKGGLTFSRICAIARFQHRVKPLSLIVVDYLGLIATDPNSKVQNRNLELGSYTRGFKALAKELGIPVVILAQLNRGIENRADSKPKMSDLRDSGEIEQDADVIIMAHRDKDSERGRNGLTEIDVVKVRHAQPGGCLLQFQGEYARFVSAAHGSYSEDEPEPERASRPSARSMMKTFKGGRS